MKRWPNLMVVVCACRASAPALPAGVEWVQQGSDPLQFEAAGFIELTTPVRPPTSTDRTAHIVTSLKLPDGAELATQLDDRGERSAVMPAGAAAVRVEYAAGPDADEPTGPSWRVLDVRGFEWAEGGRWCSVLRPTREGLSGLRWRCGLEADARAGAALAGLVRSGRLSGNAEALEKLNGCTRCHAPKKHEDRRPGVLVQRATDAEGLFSVRSVLLDEGPVERYRAVDTNAQDPLLHPVCPGSGLGGEQGCTDGQRPAARLEVAEGVRRGDRHTLAVCASRRRLFERLDAAGRAQWAGAVAPCDGLSAAPP